MCGIFGVVAPNADPEWRSTTIRRLALATQERGKDATGVAYFDEEKTLRTLKAPGSSSEFVKRESFQRILEESPGILVGHCRAGTKGSEKDNKNNHPMFDSESGIAVVHNGQVDDDIWRATDDNGENPYIYKPFQAEVDSEAILRLIETMMYIPRDENNKFSPEMVRNTPKDQWRKKVGIGRAINEAVYNLSGSYACSLLYKEEPNKVFIWRNDGRPMHVVYIEEMDALVFGSTEKIVEYGLKRSYTKYILNFFPQEHKIPPPDHYGRDLPKDFMIEVSWNPNNDTPIQITQTVLTPGEAPIFEFNDEEN